MISSGAVILRRRAGGRNWFRADLSPSGQPTQSCSDQIQRIFAAQDVLQSLDTEASLLDQRLALVPEHRMEQSLAAEGGHWVVKSARIRQTLGLACEGNVDRLVSMVLAGCDGRRRLGELVADLAKAVGLEAEQVAPSCCRVMRTLMHWGFLGAVSHE